MILSMIYYFLNKHTIWLAFYDILYAGDETNNTALIVGLTVGCTGCVLLAILIATVVIKHL